LRQRLLNRSGILHVYIIIVLIIYVYFMLETIYIYLQIKNIVPDNKL